MRVAAGLDDFFSKRAADCSSHGPQGGQGWEKKQMCTLYHVNILIFLVQEERIIGRVGMGDKNGQEILSKPAGF